MRKIYILISALVILAAMGLVFTQLVYSPSSLDDVYVGLPAKNEPPRHETTVPPHACTEEAKQCPDGSYVGRVGPDCSFAACPIEQSVPDQGVVCTEIYAPVCAVVEVQCVTAPCDPVKETYSNSCFADADVHVLTYTEGECVNGE